MDMPSWQSALFWHVKTSLVMRSMETQFTRKADLKTAAPEYWDAKPAAPTAGGLCLGAESGSDDPDARAQDKDEDDPWKAAAREHARDEGEVDPELCFTIPLAGEGTS